MTLRADPSHLSRLAAGRPMVLVAEGVMDPSPLSAPALEVWMVAERAGRLLLHPHGSRAPAPEVTVPLEAPPAAALALVASERIRVAALLRWWGEAAGTAPPFLLAATGQAALPGLVALLAESLVGSADLGAEAMRALVTARQEMEETREALAETARLLAHRPPVAPRLVLSGEAGAGEAGAGEPLAGPGRHRLGTALAGLASLAVHPAAAGTGTGLLRLRLLAAESDRVLGAWAVPAEAMRPEWLVLDLPTPLGPVGETGVLEVTPEGGAVPALLRESRWAGAEGEHPLALRAWAGSPGSRFLAPAWWMPEEVGLRLPAADLPLALPESAWAMAKTLEGRAEAAAIGDEAPRPVLRARPGARAVLLLPHVHAAGLDRVAFAFAAGGGTGAEVAAWVHPVDGAPAEARSLDRLGRGAAATGWRPLPPEGVVLTLPLATALSGRAALAVGLRAGAEEAVVELSSIALSTPGHGPARPAPAIPAPPAEAPAPAQATAAAPVGTPRPVAAVAPIPLPQAPPPAAPLPAPPPPPAPVRAAPPPMPAPAPPPAPVSRILSSPVVTPLPAPRPETPPPPRPVAAPARPAAPARFEAVRLHQHLPGDSYRHIDMTVSSLANGPARWPAVRLKLQSKDGEPRIEFRQAAGWPHMFRDWLGRASDKFGPFLRIAGPELRGFLDGMTDERDAMLMQALLAVLPRAAEEAARQAGLSVSDTAQWVETARTLLPDEAPPVA